MRGDYSRMHALFDRLKRYARTLLQRGAVLLEPDAKPPNKRRWFRWPW